MTGYTIAAASLATFVVLLGVLLFINSSRTRYPSLKTRLLALGLDECKVYVKGIALSVGDTFLYRDFVLTCDFALTFRESCGKAATSLEALNNEMCALEDRFVYGVEEVRILKDNGNLDYKFLKKSIDRLSSIRCEMQRFILKIEKLQPC